MHAPESLPNKPFSLLFVCTANHCRSPMAQFLLAQRVASLGYQWSISSAGTLAMVNEPMHEHAQQVLQDSGIDAAGFRGQQCTPELIASSDLILTMNDDHRNWVLSRHPPALNRTHNVLQFANLLGHDTTPASSPDDPGPTLLRRARVARARVRPLPPRERDVGDPMGHGLWKFAACAHLLAEAIEAMLPSRRI